MSIFDSQIFQFPYLYKFPGQASDERILFVTRENPSMLWNRRVIVFLTAFIVFVIGVGFGTFLQQLVGGNIGYLFSLLGFAMGLLFLTVGWWWVSVLWKKSIMLVTTQRLTKFIYTTPFNRHNLSLPLDMIVDTGSYTKGFLQAIFRLGTFTARSSASSSGAATDDPERINKKYFYIENVASAEDLQHYVNKLLQAFRHSHDRLFTFRPFIPELKGEQRKLFMQKYPEFWS